MNLERWVRFVILHSMTNQVYILLICDIFGDLSIHCISQQSVIYTCVFQDRNPCKQTWFNLTDQNQRMAHPTCLTYIFIVPNYWYCDIIITFIGINFVDFVKCKSFRKCYFIVLCFTNAYCCHVYLHWTFISWIY